MSLCLMGAEAEGLRPCLKKLKKKMHNINKQDSEILYSAYWSEMLLYMPTERPL